MFLPAGLGPGRYLICQGKDLVGIVGVVCAKSNSF